MFSPGAHFTDDSVMTVAVAEALLAAGPAPDLNEVRRLTVQSMQDWGRRFPRVGYGPRFFAWLTSEDPQPYHSYGNGSAMRVSAAGWLYDSLTLTREVARATADVTHNHPEGIKGAEATASAIYLARTGHSKEEIQIYIEREFGYDLRTTCDEIRPTYRHVASCQGTCPQAIRAFLEGEDFEDVVRTAVSLGGDCDTLTAISASIAEACYGMPEEMVQEVRDRIPEEMRSVADRILP